jgi:hypothetical protein
VIKESLKRYRDLLDQDDCLKTEISKWSVYQHIEHILISNSRILEQILDRSSANLPIRGISILGRIVLLTGVIPRGKGKAPDFTLPMGLSIVELKKLYYDLIEKLDQLESIKLEGIVAKHPYFGGLTKKQWLKFIEIHQRHHLKIIDDIIKA